MFTPIRQVLPSGRDLRNRRLVVVDIENVIGGAALNAHAVAWARRAIEDLCGPADSDHVVIGTSHVGLLAVGSTWGGPRHVVGSGPDGADLALLDVLDENIATRFGETILVSGDGIFTTSLAALAAAGVRTTVIAHPDGLSRRLRMTAHRVLHLAEHYQPGTLGGAA